MGDREGQSLAWGELAARLSSREAMPAAGFPQLLEAAFGAGVDDANARLVLADLLFERGHPWGHVLAAEARGDADSSGRSLVTDALGEDGAFTWDHGFVTEAVLAPSILNDGRPQHLLLQRLLEHPAGWFMKKLTLVLPRYPSLRVERAHADDFAHLAAALGGARLPFLTDLELRPRSAPELEKLVRRKTDASKVESIAPLLAPGSLPALVRLTLTNSEWNVWLIEALASSALVARLRELDLSDGVLGSGAAKILKAQAAAFSHLDVLRLTGNYFSASELQTSCGGVQPISRPPARVRVAPRSHPATRSLALCAAR